MVLGHWLEMRAISQARGALNALTALLPDTAERVSGPEIQTAGECIVASVSLCAGVVGIAVEAVALLIAYVPLKLAIAGSALGAFSPEQLHAFAHFSTQLQQSGLLLSWVFYGFDELAGGFLIFRSGFLPRVLGVLLGISGLCYLTNGFLSFLAPSLDARLYSYLSFGNARNTHGVARPNAGEQ
jgi:hypothetical protein